MWDLCFFSREVSCCLQFDFSHRKGFLPRLLRSGQSGMHWVRTPAVTLQSGIPPPAGSLWKSCHCMNVYRFLQNNSHSEKLHLYSIIHICSKYWIWIEGCLCKIINPPQKSIIRLPSPILWTLQKLPGVSSLWGCVTLAFPKVFQDFKWRPKQSVPFDGLSWWLSTRPPRALL